MLQYTQKPTYCFFISCVINQHLECAQADIVFSGVEEASLAWGMELPMEGPTVIHRLIF